MLEMGMGRRGAASLHYQVIVLHFRLGVYSATVMGFGREGKKTFKDVFFFSKPQVAVGGPVEVLPKEGRDVWRCGPL